MQSKQRLAKYKDQCLLNGPLYLLFTCRALGSALPVPYLMRSSFYQILRYPMMSMQIIPGNLNTEISIMLFQPEISIRHQLEIASYSSLTSHKHFLIIGKKEICTIGYGYHLSKQIQSHVPLDPSTQGSLHKHSHSAVEKKHFADKIGLVEKTCRS